MSQSVARRRSAAAAGSGSPAIPREEETIAAAGPGLKAAPSSSGRPPWAPTPGSRKTERGISVAQAGDVLGLGRADHRAEAAEAAVAEQASGELLDQPRKPLVQRRLRRGQVHQVGGTGVAGADEDEHPRTRLLAGGDQRLERVAAEQRVGGEGIGAEALDVAPGGRRSSRPAPARRRRR